MSGGRYREGFSKVPGANDQLKAGDTALVLVQRENIKETLALFEN